jgi:hypothetical protein
MDGPAARQRARVGFLLARNEAVKASPLCPSLCHRAVVYVLHSPKYK